MLISAISDATIPDILNHQGLKDLQTKVDPASIDKGLPKMTFVSVWVVEYAKTMGQWLDHPSSITPESYISFQKAKSYRFNATDDHLNDYRIPKPDDSVGGFKSFNEFFCRKLKEDYPFDNVRKIASRQTTDHADVVIFPADSVFDVHLPVDDKNIVNVPNTVTLKSLPWPIEALLHGCPEEYTEKFKGGTWCHAFLNTFDYHRQHAPVVGKVSTQRTTRDFSFRKTSRTTF